MVVTPTLLDRVLALPSVPFVDREARLPDRPGLYFAVSGSEVLYIGMSRKSIRGRWKTLHHAAVQAKKRGIEGDIRIAFIVYRDPDRVRDDEKAVIREIRPPWNFMHVPGALERQQQESAEACKWIDCDEHYHHRWPQREPPTKSRPCVCIVHAHCAGPPPPARPRPPPDQPPPTARRVTAA